MSFNPNLTIQQDPFSGLLPNTLASAASVSPTNAVTLISGTTSIATIVPPTRATHQLTFIFTDAAPGALLTTGNIAAAITPVQNIALTFQYEPRTGKYHPDSSAGGVGAAYRYFVPVTAGGAGTFNPADGTAYFIGSYSQVNPDTSELTGPTVLTNGIISAASLTTVVGGTTASTEVVTISVRNVTQNLTAVVGTQLWSAIGPDTVGNVALAVPVAVGDRIGIRALTPTFATNPTAVFLMGSIYITSTN